MSVPEHATGVLLDHASSVPPCDVTELAAQSGGVLVIAPHPDDETLGCGLAIRSVLAAGRDVAILLLTGGGASHPASRSCPPNAMKTLRRTEFEAAIRALGADLPPVAGTLTHRMLDLPDGRVPWHGPDADHALESALELARNVDARTVWTTWAGDPHADHGAASALADRLCETERFALRRDYAVWGRFREAGENVPESAVLAFDAPAHRPAKRAAMRAYRSQLTPMIADDPEGFVMPPALVEHFAETPEIFLPPSVEAVAPEVPMALAV